MLSVKILSLVSGFVHTVSASVAREMVYGMLS